MTQQAFRHTFPWEHQLGADTGAGHPQEEASSKKQEGYGSPAPQDQGLFGRGQLRNHLTRHFCRCILTATSSTCFFVCSSLGGGGFLGQKQTKKCGSLPPSWRCVAPMSGRKGDWLMIWLAPFSRIAGPFMCQLKILVELLC